MSKSTKDFSSKQEAMVAEALGGYQIGGSGAFATAPGDVKTYEWLVECKTHTTSDHPIFFDLDVWKKIQYEAMGIHRKPVLVVDDGSQKEERTWCLCSTKNLDLTKVLLTDLRFEVKKNISAKHERLKEAITVKGTKENEGLFNIIDYILLVTEWGGEEVCIMPLSTFKELFER